MPFLDSLLRYGRPPVKNDPRVVIAENVKPFVLPEDQFPSSGGEYAAQEKPKNISVTPSMDIASTIRAAATQYGLDPNVMLRIAQMESGLDPSAANPTSSARGVFQFIGPTWAQYGNGASPTDPTANIDAGMRFTRDNVATLRASLGRVPTPGEIYLAHQQGAGGALKMLQNPSAPVGGDAIALNGGKSGMTGGDFASRWMSKFDGKTQMASAVAPGAPNGGPAAYAVPETELSPLAQTLQQNAPRRQKRPGGPLVLS